jgi:hypothetical protein
MDQAAPHGQQGTESLRSFRRFVLFIITHPFAITQEMEFDYNNEVGAAYANAGQDKRKYNRGAF